ncbi:hypothetical protein FRC12_004095 [Ceratobasidium sp. 428]|nr:hypothetical protein FRC12_004095 [Ceratobasidium sp. 428]
MLTHNHPRSPPLSYRNNDAVSLSGVLPSPRPPAGVVASAIRPPSLVHLSMRPSLPRLSSASGRSSRSSFEFTASTSSVTPLTPDANHADLEKHSFSNEDNLCKAIARDLAIPQPIEEHYHRQRPW